MSVVAVRRYKDEIILAADSIMMRGDQKKSIVKIVRNKKYGNFAAGFVGNGGFIEFEKEFVRNNFPQENTFSCVAGYVKAMMDYFRDFFEIEDMKEAMEGSSMIFVYNDKIWTFDGGCLAEVTNEYYSIGAAFVEVDTLMHTGMDPETAIAVATEINLAISLPVVKEVIQIDAIKKPIKRIITKKAKKNEKGKK